MPLKIAARKIDTLFWLGVLSIIATSIFSAIIIKNGLYTRKLVEYIETLLEERL